MYALAEFRGVTFLPMGAFATAEIGETVFLKKFTKLQNIGKFHKGAVTGTRAGCVGGILVGVGVPETWWLLLGTGASSEPQNTGADKPPACTIPARMAFA